jgi:hypothetical protein
LLLTVFFGELRGHGCSDQVFLLLSAEEAEASTAPFEGFVALILHASHESELSKRVVDTW